jgi:hypothetical protein
LRVTFEQADLVAGKLSRKLGSPAWLRGIGVVPDREEGFAVSVRIATDAPAPALPERLDGVVIRTERRSLARAAT